MLGKFDLADQFVGHQLIDVFLAADVPVQRGRSCPELGRDIAHRDRLEPLAVSELDRGPGYPLAAQVGTRLASRPRRPKPEWRRLVVVRNLRLCHACSDIVLLATRWTDLLQCSIIEQCTIRRSY